MKKIFWVILALLAGVSYFLVAPVAEDLGNCFDESTARLNQLSERAEEENWGKEQICRKGKEEFALLKLCLSNVRKQRKVPEFLFSTIQQIARSGRVMRDQIEIHNGVCSEYPATLIEN